MRFSEQEPAGCIKYLDLLAQSYPNIQAACTEIINLRAILNLPKGTEHFISDIHGEYEAFTHILRNASGSIRGKIEQAFGDTLPDEQKNMLATLIYYPERKLEDIRAKRLNTRQWYHDTLCRMVEVCRLATTKYTRSKVQKALPDDFGYIISELINTENNSYNKEGYYQQILDSIIDIQQADAFIIALSRLAQRMVIDKLHILGDIYDRGDGAHLVMEDLCRHHNVDFTWGNHDVVWMGAASGQLACIANVLRNSLRYNNFDVLEDGYGINVRPLTLFALEQYADDPCTCFYPKHVDHTTPGDTQDDRIAAKLHKAIAIIQFKLEGQLILAHPEYEMQDRLLLDKMDLARGIVRIGGREYPLTDTSFPTLIPETPYSLSPAEQQVMDKLRISFLHSEKLQKHKNLLFKKGAMYKTVNNMLLYHGCVPMEADGSFSALTVDGTAYRGRALMDYSDKMCRQGAFGSPGSKEKENGLDFMWFLWCGPKSPLNGKEKMATFERYFLSDKAVQAEPQDPYYTLANKSEYVDAILREFQLTSPLSRIVNGHMPVKIRVGESPLKAGGRRIIIDGGISRAYQPVTGIAGYTLISNSNELYLSEHHTFSGIDEVIRTDGDMDSKIIPVFPYPHRMKIRDTDDGLRLQEKINDLEMLLEAFRQGTISQST